MNDQERIKEAVRAFNRIQALAENPHWTAERRWRIGEIAGEGMSLLAPLVKTEKPKTGEERKQ